MECKEEVVTYLGGEFGTIACIKRDLANIANSFINIGFRLHEADLFQYYREKGYSSIYEMAAVEFDMKKSVVSRYINVYKRFHSLEGKQMDIRARYRKYNYSQLCEMLSLSDNEIEELKINSDMTVAEIRQIKKNKKNCYESDDITSDETSLSSDVENTCCDVATEENENAVIDVEFKEVKKCKSAWDVLSFGDFCCMPNIHSRLIDIVQHNTKKEIADKVFDIFCECSEKYYDYLVKELGE